MNVAGVGDGVRVRYLGAGEELSQLAEPAGRRFMVADRGERHRQFYRGRPSVKPSRSARWNAGRVGPRTRAFLFCEIRPHVRSGTLDRQSTSSVVVGWIGAFWCEDSAMRGEL